MICKHCKASIPDDSADCPLCGKSLGWGPVKKALAAVVAVAAVVVVYLFYPGQPVDHVRVVSHTFKEDSVTVTVRNNSDKRIKDVQFRIEYIAPSGTTLGSEKKTAYEIFAPRVDSMVTVPVLGEYQAETVKVSVTGGKWAE